MSINENKPIVNFDELQKLMEEHEEIAVFAPKHMVEEAEKQIKTKLSRVEGKATALNNQIDKLKEAAKEIISGDFGNTVKTFEIKLNGVANRQFYDFEDNLEKKLKSLNNEIIEQEKKLLTLEPTAKYYSAIVAAVLDVVKERGYELTSENVTEIVCKSLDVASYQKWQEIKGENWGKNNTENKKYKVI